MEKTIKEYPSSYYDDVFITSVWFTSGNAEMSYAAIYQKAVEDIFQQSDVNILELGCGLGMFPDFIKKKEHTYFGLDFSKVAIKTCKDKGYNVKLHDLRNGIPDLEYNVIVSFETLEHIIEDVKLLSEIKPGTLVCLSVPMFDDPSHVRYFENIEEVLERFSMLKLIRCEKINRWFYLSGIK